MHKKLGEIHHQGQKKQKDKMPPMINPRELRHLINSEIKSAKENQ